MRYRFNNLIQNQNTRIPGVPTFDCMTEHHSVKMYGDRKGKAPINVYLISSKSCVVSLVLVRN